MANTINVDDWLKFIESEYLSSFIRESGASIKFAVTPEEKKLEICQALSEHCADLGYVTVHLDAVATRVHMPQDIFVGIAHQLDWRQLARQVIVRLAGEADLRIDGVDSSSSDNIFESIGMVNRIDAQSVLHELRPQIVTKVFRNDQMAKDFRTAMFQLCLNENVRNLDYQGQPLVDWLTGLHSRMSYVKQFYIYTSINRTTARHFIESLLYWIQFAGYAGTVILLDNSRVTVAPNPKDGLRFYTKAMMLDHYELLREFIDGTDRLTGTLVIVLTNSEFLDEEPGSRGFGSYRALMTRVMDDIRDKNLVNPVASLVRLA